MNSWRIGKTSATINFVNEATEFLVGQPKVAPILALEKYVKQLKSGEKVLLEDKTVKEFLNSPSVSNMG